MSRHYLDSHEWAQIDGEAVTVGLSTFAAGEVGEVIHIELPEVGDTVTKGESMGEIESVKSVHDVYAPIDGEIIAINEELAETPELVNQDAQGKGWFVKVKPSAQAPLEGLMDDEAYQAHISA